MKWIIKKADETKALKVFIVCFFIVMLALSFLYNGTSDEGDSVMHYLMARNAFNRPDFFFDQWAKPVYMLVAAPFSQLGFWGVKLMNILLACGSMWFTYKTAKMLSISNAWATVIVFAFIPMNIALILSGLTDVLFAFVLILGINILIKEQYYKALLIFSFLPFVRSEGLIILCVLVIYLVIIEKYRLIPLLATGHIFYSVTGYFVHKDFLWVFNKMSYATLSSSYGSGKWLHFAQKLPETTGKAGAIFTCVGICWGIIMLIQWMRRKLLQAEEKQLILIYGIFTAFFIGHSAFWALGIFNSMGLIRVMIGVMPLYAIIIVQGINFVLAPLEPFKPKKYVLALLVAVMVLYPFSKDVYALHWRRDLVLHADQYADKALAKYVREKYSDYKRYEFYYEPSYLSVVLGLNYFDEKQHKRLLYAFERNQFADKCFLIWDDWFAVQEGQVPLEKIEQDGRFEKIETFQRLDYWGVIRTTVLFRKK